MVPYARIMNPKNEEALRRRVIAAAEAALAHHSFVSAIDMFTGMGILSPANLKLWRYGSVGCLERVVELNLKRISLAMKMLRQWAYGKKLIPRETVYKRRGAPGFLRFSVSGTPGIETAYRIHYVDPLAARRAREIRRAIQAGENSTVPRKNGEVNADHGGPEDQGCFPGAETEILTPGASAAAGGGGSGDPLGVCLKNVIRRVRQGPWRRPGLRGGPNRRFHSMVPERRGHPCRPRNTRRSVRQRR